MIDAVSAAFVSGLETTRPMAASHGWHNNRSTRSRPAWLRLHCGTGTAGSICTSGCET